jgi:cell division protein FtsB
MTMTVPRVSITSLGLSAAIVYLAAHAVTGEQGVAGVFRLTEKERALSAELATLESERLTLSARVAGLSDKTLDRDLLEERARVVLGAAYPDEVFLTMAAPAAPR